VIERIENRITYSGVNLFQAFVQGRRRELMLLRDVLLSHGQKAFCSRLFVVKRALDLLVMFEVSGARRRCGMVVNLVLAA
jgi:hypothetical protein